MFKVVGLVALCALGACSGYQGGYGGGNPGLANALLNYSAIMSRQANPSYRPVGPSICNVDPFGRGAVLVDCQ